MRKIYVASSWKNMAQPAVVQALRAVGHKVYDFRNPKEGDRGFAWEEIDKDWKKWGLSEYVRALEHPAAKRGFKFDMDALKWADTCVLLLPCGKSAHLELGYAVGMKKTTVILAGETEQPELMYKMVDLITPSMFHVVAFLNKKGK
jgi:hypothetical protein